MNALEVLTERQSQGWTSQDADGKWVYAAVDGGCFASVVSLGALHQLGEVGLLQYLNGLAGSSGGSFNAASAMTGKTLTAREIYTTFLPEHEFIRYKSPAIVLQTANWEVLVRDLPKPWVNMNTLREAITNVYPLDTDTLVRDERTLMIGLSNLTKAKPDFVTNHNLKGDPSKMTDYLLSGARIGMGVASPYTKQENGEVYADATIFWPTTDAIARRDNPSHVLSIASTPQPLVARSRKQGAADWLNARFAAKYSKDGPEAIRRMAVKRDLLLRMFLESKNVQVKNTVISRIYPEAGPLPSRLTTDKDLLNKGFEAGRVAVVKALSELKAA